jgi:hypothetical protein
MPEKKKVNTSMNNATNRVADAIQGASYHGFDKVTNQLLKNSKKPCT